MAGVLEKRGENMVLIDTWWNVNISAKDVVNNAIHVLIDTWWNVNMFRTGHILKRPPF